MVDSEYSKDSCKSSKMNIGAIIKNQEIVKLVSDHLKTKHAVNMCNCVNMQLKNTFRNKLCS